MSTEEIMTLVRQYGTSLWLEATAIKRGEIDQKQEARSGALFTSVEASMVAFMREAYNAAYKTGYGNGTCDVEHDDVGVHGEEPGDSFDIWMFERQGETHPSDLPFGPPELGHCRAYRGASCIAWAREGACPHVVEAQWLRRQPEAGEWTSKEKANEQ